MAPGRSIQRRGAMPCRLALLLTVLAVAAPAVAGVLPDDRADVLYHLYDGGGVTIDGPSVLLRKKVGKSFSFSGNYYVDMVSSASIDVVTTASPYEEERTQIGVGMTYLHANTTMNVGYTTSEENDFDAETVAFSVSQDMFGDLTTVTLSYALGDNTVGNILDENFSEEADRQQYAVGISQILTRNLIAGFDFEVITDEGFLNNPYRSVRFLNDTGSGFGFQSEVYPNTRTSSAAAIRGRYFLPYRAAVHAEYRYFEDTWGIQAHTGEIGYTHPWKMGLTFDLKYRYYTQTEADFFSDLFPRQDAQNFMARDKELSRFNNTLIRFGVRKDFLEGGWKFVERGSVTLFWDHVTYDYENFRDIRERLDANGQPLFLPGEEPLYTFDADVVQLFVSFWL